jgi:hypothetical protein
MKAKTKILIIVRGGVVQDVISTEPVEYILKDWDNIDAGDEFNPNETFPATVMKEKEFNKEVLKSNKW